jgi:hypothetical protein
MGAQQVETLKEVWGEIYWNWADWLPWIGIQVLFCATVGAVIQWWFKKGLAAFLILLTLSLASTFHRLSAPVLSKQDMIRLNADLPKVEDGVALESISFSHRVLTFNYSSIYPLEGIAAELNESDPLAGYCGDFGRWLSTRQIKWVDFIYVHAGGEEKRTLTAAHCPVSGDGPAGS